MGVGVGFGVVAGNVVATAVLLALLLPALQHLNLRSNPHPLPVPPFCTTVTSAPICMTSNWSGKFVLCPAPIQLPLFTTLGHFTAPAPAGSHAVLIFEAELPAVTKTQCALLEDAVGGGTIDGPGVGRGALVVHSAMGVGAGEGEAVKAAYGAALVGASPMSS